MHNIFLYFSGLITNKIRHDACVNNMDLILAFFIPDLAPPPIIFTIICYNIQSKSNLYKIKKNLKTIKNIVKHTVKDGNIPVSGAAK